MPRNASGNYTLPLPSVVTGTVIESLWANTTMNDLAASVTDSLDRYGRGGMVAPFRMVDGTAAVPAISFTGETNTGLYRPSAGVISVSVLGAEKQTWTSAGTTVGGDFNLLGDFNILGGVEIDGSVLLADDEWLAWGSAVPPFGPYISGSNVTDTMVFSTNSLERMRVDSAGFVGVGTPTPQARLHAKGAAELLRLETTTARGSGNNYMTWHDPTGRKGYVGYGGSNDNFSLVNELAGAMLFYTNNNERLNIAASGGIGVNGAATVGVFDVNSSGAGIISKSASEAGSVAHLGVYNLNVNGLQWYAAMNGVHIDIHNPRGEQRYFVGGVQKLGMASNVVYVTGNFSSQSGPHSINFIPGPPPALQFFHSGIVEWRIWADATAALCFVVATSPERMRLTNAGQLIVGYTFAGLQNINAQSLEGPAGYGVWNHVGGTAAATRYLYFGYGGGECGSITQVGAGTGVAFNTTSDGRLKEAIIDLPDQGAIIDALRPVEFAFKAEPEVRRRGLIAQEAVEVLPEIVAEGDVWGIDYGKLTPILLRELQSLRARVAALEV